MAEGSWRGGAPLGRSIGRHKSFPPSGPRHKACSARPACRGTGRSPTPPMTEREIISDQMKTNIPALDRVDTCRSISVKDLTDPIAGTPASRRKGQDRAECPTVAMSDRLWVMLCNPQPRRPPGYPPKRLTKKRAHQSE
jgi:hypothetical protein